MFAMSDTQQFNWQLPLFAILAAAVLLLLLFFWSPDADLLYILVIGPAVCLACLTLLVIAVFRRRQRQALSIFLTLVGVLFVSIALLKYEPAVRPWLRWLVLSNRLKSQVLAQSTPESGQLRHIEWDGWGGTPVGDWTAYVVFDPTDSLSNAATDQSGGRFAGIPCHVDAVRRLETHWYSVTLSMNEWWDQCGDPNGATIGQMKH
jgi:hypothetical protein